MASGKAGDSTAGYGCEARVRRRRFVPGSGTATGETADDSGAGGVLDTVWSESGRKTGREDPFTEFTPAILKLNEVVTQGAFVPFWRRFGHPPAVRGHFGG